MIIHDAATTFTIVIGAAFAWVETLAITAAFVLCVVGLSAAPLFAPTTRRGIRRPEPVRRRTPSWACTQPRRNYDEAA